MRVLVINGANLNMLGHRDPTQYGTQTLADIADLVHVTCQSAQTEWFTTNHEGAIIDRLQSVVLNKDADAVIINAGAYTHYSYAIRDALEMLTVPKVEVHLSNIYKRESFRHTSVLSDVCDQVIVGHGAQGYVMAVQYCLERAR